jgi:uncharacterized protein
MSIKINDPVFGTHIIKEPVLCELIKTKSMKRLENISNNGAPEKYYYKNQFSRLEHSLGCLILSEIFNANLEEKVACLLHDINHTAFSHIYDILIENHEEDYQDKTFFEFLNNTQEIKDIFEKYKININNFKNFEKFKLLDKSKPQVCIDRLEYCLREFYYITKNKNYIKNIIFNIKITENDEIIFKTKSAAKDFAESYLYLFLNRWNKPRNIEKQIFFANILKIAISKDIIKYKDFKKDDIFIIEKLESTNDTEIQNKLKKLKEDTFIIENKKKKKLRYVNPKYIYENNNIIDLISTDHNYRNKINNIMKDYE